MIILAIRTDKPEAQILLYDERTELTSLKWHAHRELSSTILVKIKELLDQNEKQWPDIQGIVFYKGPGSFTGLRIGASVANAIAQANSANLVQMNGDNWIGQGIVQLLDGVNMQALPEYGAEPHITKQRK